MPRGVPNEDKYTGRRYGKDGQLEVLGWDGSRDSSGTRLYSVKCHVCAKDAELFGDAIFKFRAGCLNQGKMPCGCTAGVRWKPWQYEVLLRRQAEKGKFKIVAIPDEILNQESRVGSECCICNCKWDAAINCYMSGRGCPRCGSRRAKANHRKPDAEMVERFMATGAFIEGTKFTRVLTENERGFDVSDWQVYCPVCSEDEYVHAGVCCGRFRSEHSNLSAGKRPCRCSKQNKWTREQREYQITKLCANTPYNFVSWIDNKKFGAFDKFTIKCDEHGEWTAGVDKFVNGGQRCPACAHSGFASQLDGSVYVLQAEGRHSFAGYGISNVPDRRLSDHSRNLKRAGFTIGTTQIFHCTGQQAWDIEQALKKRFPCNPQDIEGFRTEATYYEYYQDVVDFVDRWLFENT